MFLLRAVYKLLHDLYIGLFIVVFIEWLFSLSFTDELCRSFVVICTCCYGFKWVYRLLVAKEKAAFCFPNELEEPPYRTKTTESGEIVFDNYTLQYAASSMQGWRDNMEDAHVITKNEEMGYSLFSVLDGHGGAQVAKLCKEWLPKELHEALKKKGNLGEGMLEVFYQVFTTIDKNLRAYGLPDPQRTPKVPYTFLTGLGIDGFNEFHHIGCTCVCAIIDEDKITVANIGDSRAMLCRDGDAVLLSHDHKPESPREKKRILRAGGSVTQIGPCFRVDQGLNLSRAFGDFAYKLDSTVPPEDQKISSVPDVIVEPLTDKDEFILLACDGIFELMGSREVIFFIRQRIQRNIPLEKICELLLDECCTPNPRLTHGKGTDNETVMIIRRTRKEKRSK